MRSSIVPIQVEATRFIANLCSSTTDLTNHIISMGGHVLFISFLSHPSLLHKQLGALGISNISSQQRYHEIMMKSGLFEPCLRTIKHADMDHRVTRYLVKALACKCCSRNS